MRVFDHPNYHGGFVCPVCKTSADRPVVLIPIPGTEQGNNMEAHQVHAECATTTQQGAPAPTGER